MIEIFDTFVYFEAIWGHSSKDQVKVMIEISLNSTGVRLYDIQSYHIQMGMLYRAAGKLFTHNYDE